MQVSKSFLRTLPFLLVVLLAPVASVSAAAADDSSKEGSKSAGATRDRKSDGEALTYATMFKNVSWKVGPMQGDLKGTAEIKVPEGFIFTDGDGTRKVLEASGNLTSGNEVGFISPTSMVWSVIFRFTNDGYIKDDEKDKLDADKMLKTISKAVEESNEERKERGLPTMRIVGWEQPPHYDPETHNLEWALRGESEGGHQIVNYNTRILGRRGVMEAKLIVDPDDLKKTLPEFKSLLRAYDYKSGERYAEYKQGDKLASYGLAALVTGGAVAVAAKTGLLSALILFAKKGFKLIALAIIGIVAGIKRLITGRSARE